MSLRVAMQCRAVRVDRDTMFYEAVSMGGACRPTHRRLMANLHRGAGASAPGDAKDGTVSRTT